MPQEVQELLDDALEQQQAAAAQPRRPQPAHLLAFLETMERRYYLSDLPVGIGTFARATRGHWGVQNQRHRALDVQFGEDQSRALAGHAAENLATLRRLALNLLRRDKPKRRGIKGQQLNAGWNHQYLPHFWAF